jgi:cytochrome o ubiquinol oxidase subunit II
MTWLRRQPSTMHIPAHTRSPAQRKWMRVLACLCVAWGLVGCEHGILAPRGPVALAEKTILVDSLVIMLAIAVPTILATAAFAWWYRASNTRARYRPDFAYAGQVELVVWFIPAMVVILLGGVTWIGAHALDPARPLAGPKALEVQVVSLDWKWLFIYPQHGVASVNQLQLPVGQPVHFSLTSASVLNAFFVPQLGSMIYTMNGMVTQLNLKADAPGTFPGLSSHFSGDGFSDMHFEVHVVTAAQFAAWTDALRSSAPRLDQAAYLSLAQQDVRAPMSFGSTDQGLFERIVRQSAPPAAGPSTQAGGAVQAAARVH